MNLVGFISLFVCYGCQLTTMDAVLANIVAGGGAWFQQTWKLINI